MPAKAGMTRIEGRHITKAIPATIVAIFRRRARIGRFKLKSISLRAD
jgi:hypothetical protein